MQQSEGSEGVAGVAANEVMVAVGSDVTTAAMQQVVEVS